MTAGKKIKKPRPISRTEVLKKVRKDMPPPVSVIESKKTKKKRPGKKELKELIEDEES
ncbi:MAG: hypothetical protein KAR06_03385 [Deltaproteobacteria bacterium]|nr:hypothetical protein [Deltaproteobacteria bacterium]